MRGAKLIPELSKFQVMILTKIANGRSKIYGACSGCDADRKRHLIDKDFTEALALVSYGLFDECTDIPHYRAICDKYELEGRQLAVLRMTTLGQAMFGKVTWNQIN